MLEEHQRFIWRLLRRFGVPESEADDAAQEVFCVAARRIADIKPGSERSFLYGVAIRVGADVRRRRGRRREEHVTGAITGAHLTGAGVETNVNSKMARALLDEVLDEMDDALREVFVLFEFEEMQVKEIAVMLGVPVGTVGSRLRRARERFSESAGRLRARMEFGQHSA
jgi:RNA polymerase sigma-70 factor (ECF subfamily)